MRKLMLCLSLVGMAGSAVGQEVAPRAYNPCAWFVSVTVLDLNNPPSTDTTTAPAMSWTVKAVSAGQYSTVLGAQEQAEHVALVGVWTKMSPTPTNQTATLYPPSMIQSVLVQGPSDPRCEAVQTFRRTPPGRRER